MKYIIVQIKNEGNHSLRKSVAKKEISFTVPIRVCPNSLPHCPDGTAAQMKVAVAHQDPGTDNVLSCRIPSSGYGLVAMTFASHAKGREFDPHYPYFFPTDMTGEWMFPAQPRVWGILPDAS